MPVDSMPPLNTAVTDVNDWRSSDLDYGALHASFRIDIPGRFNMAEDTVGRHAKGARADTPAKSAGYRIGPAEVEDCLIAHPAVAEAAVFGVPDPERGQVVTAHVRLAYGFEGTAVLVQALQAHVKKRLAPYKPPRIIRFVTAFPLTSTGKISRKALRAEAEPPAPTPLICAAARLAPDFSRRPACARK